MAASWQVIWWRNGAYTFLKRTTTVRGSGASTPSTLAKARRVRGWNFASTSSIVYLTSAEVKGCPSCHLTPGWSAKLMRRPSLLTVQERASSGCGFQSRSR